MKKILKISLITLILGLFILGAGFSLAVSAPGGLTPCTEEDISLSPLFDWSDVSGVDHYELYYKRIDETTWTDRYPSVSQYQVTGLSPDKEYQWYVVSCGDPDCADSASAGICSFTTEELTPPGNGGVGNGGIPIGLINPLKAKTLEEAINALINFLFYLAMAVAPILIIYAAFLLLTAAGDAAKINKARTIILWTLVAVAIILLAKGLPSVIKGVLGG